MARLRPGKPPLDLPQTLLFCTVLVPVKHNQALIQGRVIQNQAGGQGERILNGTDIPDLQDRRITLHEIMERASDHIGWGPYVEELRSWLLERASVLNLKPIEPCG